MMIDKTQDLMMRDLLHIWHPCSQMKDYETFLPLIVKRAMGCQIELADGSTLIDAISSWWCKTFGHQHPALKKALLAQLDRFEHVLLANTTNEQIVALSEQLAGLTQSLNKVFYAGDGSSAIEVALKMSLHAQRLRGHSKRTAWIALKHSYHGETTGAMSVSDVGIYRKPYEPMLFNTHFIEHIPYVLSDQDPLWADCGEVWPLIEQSLLPYAETACALILEPIVQGAGGMKIYSQDFLSRLRQWTKQHQVYLIADEIMTGVGRTGKWLACEHAQIEPDFVCLSKGLTGGWLPFSAVLTEQAIYDLFYADYDLGRSFLHSHTFSGNALGVALALSVLQLMRTENFCERATVIGKHMHALMQSIADQTEKLHQVRSLGAMVAADLKTTNATRRIGYEIYQQAVKRGALLRPIGNTIYWLPPLIINEITLQDLKNITEQAILAVNF